MHLKLLQWFRDRVQSLFKDLVIIKQDFSRGSAVKSLPAMQKTQVRSLGWKDPLEKEMATHSSVLAWEIPWTRSLEGYSPWGLKESDTTEWLSTHTDLQILLSSLGEGGHYRTCLGLQSLLRTKSFFKITKYLFLSMPAVLQNKSWSLPWFPLSFWMNHLQDKWFPDLLYIKYFM